MGMKRVMQIPFKRFYIDERPDLNFHEVYETIKEYYPIGISMNYEKIQQLEPIKRLNKKIQDYIYSEEESNEWSNYLEKLGEYFPDKKIFGNTKIQPGYGGVIEIGKTKGDEIISKELHFYKSFLGKYYTIFGVDNIQYFDGEYYYMRFDPIITISPFDKYEEYFNAIKYQMGIDFPDYKFIPFDMGTLKIRGLSTIFSNELDNRDSTINQALFVNQDYGKYNFIGDRTFGYDYWSPNIKENNWIAYPPKK
jgi:hypothetical protein